MDAFRTLTGGSRFDQNRFKADISHFQNKAPIASTSATPAAALPAELDFFASPSASSTRTAAEPKQDRKRKRSHAAASADALELEGNAAGSGLPAEAREHVDSAALLRQHKIKLTGLDLPEPVPSVDDLAAHVRAASTGDAHRDGAAKVAATERLARRWRQLGLKDPTGIQMAAWGTMLAGRDILACAPTGSGKTYSFILPLLALLPPSTAAGRDAEAAEAALKAGEKAPLRPRAVVIEPTRELSIQVLREARKLAASGSDEEEEEQERGWKIAVLGEEGVGVPVGQGGSKKKQKKKSKAAAQEAGSEAADSAAGAPSEQPAYEGPIDILITTPLRLVFALKSNLVSLATCEHLVLDEADKLFELNFLEQTDEILAACGAGSASESGTGSRVVRKGMFSATMPSTVEELAKGVMAGAGSGMIRAIVGHKEAATTTIDQSLMFVNREDHKLLSLRSLITSGQFTPPVLIFVQSILRAKELANELVFDGINADAIHADRSASERDEVVRQFAAGQVWCLICTDVMARGIDFKGVKLVINYDFPQSAMSYIHRIGRTGRAGKAGRAITFFSKADAGHLKTIVNVMRASGCSVPDWMLALPNASQNAKKQLKQRPIGRKDISRTLGAGALDDAEEGARTKDRSAAAGGGKKKRGKGRAAAPGKKERVMSGVGSGFAGGGARKARQAGGDGVAGDTKKEKAQRGKGAQAEGKEGAPRPAKKAKREVALDE